MCVCESVTVRMLASMMGALGPAMVTVQGVKEQPFPE